jgi:glycosyltransferase involved in cell wall biosynthesis
MPVYRCERFIASAINSILTQTYQNLELIIVDDNSPDNTYQIANSFSDRRLSVYRNKTNSGPSLSLNKAIELSSGEFIAVMHGDDLATPKRIKNQVRFLLKNSDIDMVGTQYRAINIEGTKTGERSNFPSHPDEIAFSLLFDNVLCHPTLMMRKERLAKLGLQYNVECRLNEDYELFSRSILNGMRIANLKSVGVYYRRHQSQASMVHRQLEQVQFLSLKRNYRKLFNDALNVLIDQIEHLEPATILNVLRAIEQSQVPQVAKDLLLNQLIMNMHANIKYSKWKTEELSFREYLLFLKYAGIKGMNIPIFYQLVKKELLQ